MSKFINWLVHKCGGYTREEYDEMRELHLRDITVLEHILQNERNFNLKQTPKSVDVITLKSSKIIPRVDGDYEIYVRQQIASELGEALMDNNMIEWNIEDFLDEEKTVTGTIRVLEPQWRPLICGM